MCEQRTALITGATGFIGSHLVNLCEARGWQVVGGFFADLPPKCWGTGTTYINLDVIDGDQVRWAVEKYKPRYIFHLAAQSSPQDSWSSPELTLRCNVLGSLNVLEAARALKIPPIVVSACSSAEYGHVSESEVPVEEEHYLAPINPYGASKLCADFLGIQYFQAHGIPTVNLRLFNTTGPGKVKDAPSDFIRQLVRIKSGLQPGIVETGNLGTRRAFLDVRDAVRAFQFAVSKAKPGNVYNVCSSSAISIRELLDLAIEIAGIDVEICPTPRLMRTADESIIFGSSQKFTRDTGWRNRVSLRQTLESIFDYWNRYYFSRRNSC